MGDIFAREDSVKNEPDLEGKTVRLEGLSLRHVSDRYAGWFNNKEVCRDNRHGGVVYTLDMTRSYVESVDFSDSIAAFAIITRGSGEHVGNISLKVNWEDNTGEISIIIGEKDYWGKGIATEAYKLVIDYGFSTLGLEKLYSGMTARNKGMIKAAEKSGMSYEGTSERSFIKDGQYLDVVRCSIISSGGIKPREEGK